MDYGMKYVYLWFIFLLHGRHFWSVASIFSRLSNYSNVINDFFRLYCSIFSWIFGVDSALYSPPLTISFSLWKSLWKWPPNSERSGRVEGMGESPVSCSNGDIALTIHVTVIIIHPPVIPIYLFIYLYWELYSYFLNSSYRSKCNTNLCNGSSSINQHE